MIARGASEMEAGELYAARYESRPANVAGAMGGAVKLETLDTSLYRTYNLDQIPEC